MEWKILSNSFLYLGIVIIVLNTSCKSGVEYSGLQSSLLSDTIIRCNVNVNLKAKQINIKTDGQEEKKGIIINSKEIEFTKKSSGLKEIAAFKLVNDEVFITFSDSINQTNIIAKTEKSGNQKYLKEVEQILLEKRKKLNNKQISFLLLSISSSKAPVERIFRKDGDIIKEPENGSVFYVFDEYSSLYEKLGSSDPVKRLYEGGLIEIMEEKRPFLVSITTREGVISGNRFKTGGLTRTDVGETYEYGNYSSSVTIKDFRFYYLNKSDLKILSSTFGYRILLENKGNSWAIYSEGMYSYYDDQPLRMLKGSKINQFLISEILPKIECDYLNNRVIKNGFLDIGIFTSNKLSWHKADESEIKTYCQYARL